MKTRGERIRTLVSCLGYAKQFRAMLFSGFLTPRESTLAAKGAMAVMEPDEIAEAHAIVEREWPARDRCAAELDGERCALFDGHPGPHCALTVRTWSTEVRR